MKYEGFVGPTYQALSGSVSADRCVNWSPEIVPTGAGKSKINYYPTPGLTLHADTSALGVGRGLYELDGRMFAVIGPSAIEFFADGTTAPLGQVANDGLPVAFQANMIASAKRGYSLTGNVFAQITGGFEPDGITAGSFFGAADLGFLDGYVLALTPDSRQFQLSGINDVINWSALDVSTNGGVVDKLVGLIADHEYAYLFTGRRGVVYYNSGNADFPIVPVSGAFIEQGLLAKSTLKRAGDTLMWIGQNESGGARAFRAQGFVPTPVSTPAVEQAWQKYAIASDAVAFVDQRNGHSEYRVTFPTGDTSWCFDLQTNMWHERASLDGETGLLHAQIQRFHCFNGGVHYVLGTDGIIYREDQAQARMDGVHQRQFMRVAPVVSNENKQMFFDRLEVDIEPGIGTDGDPTVETANPQMVMDYSNDGGKNYSNEEQTGAGPIGDNLARAYWQMLGSGRKRNFRVKTNDPIVLVDAYLDFTSGAH